MKKRTIESPTKNIEMIDESDSTEDSEDEDYQLGDDLFSKASSKSSNKTPKHRRNYRVKSVKSEEKVTATRNQTKESDYKEETPAPPKTSKLFQIVIMRKHARLSSCLQRTYLSLTSEEKYETIAEIMSFICECAGFKPNLIEAHYLEESSKKFEEKGGSKMSREDFGWDSFRNCYSELPKKVTYEDVLNYKSAQEVEERELYGRTINFEKGESIAHQFYAMCNTRMKNLTRQLEVKDGWMIDLGSAGFPRFCEFFSEMILQVEMQYFKELLLLLQWVFSLSLSPYRSIRLLSCVACNEVISSLLIKLETLRKDQVVLKKQLSVEAELDKRASGRMGNTKVNLSGSTLELYKKLNLVSTTCVVISSLVKSSFYLNYSSKAFDVFTDIRVIASYYMVVHYLINAPMYENELYLELVSNFILNEDDNLTLLLKYLLVWNRGINYRIVDKLLEIYPGEKREVNELVEFILLKYIDPEEGSLKDEETVNKVKSILFDEDFVHKNVTESNSVYFCALFLMNHFPEYEFQLKFNLNLSNLRNKYTYAINQSNKEYNHYVYKYNRGKQTREKEGEEEVRNLKLLVKVLLKYKSSIKFEDFVKNLVENLLKLKFISVNLSCLKYDNYRNFTNELEAQTMYNEVVRVAVERVSEWAQEKKEKEEEGERIRNLEDLVEHSEELYKVNKNSKKNMWNIMEVFKNVSNYNLANKMKLGELVLNNFKNMLSSSKLTEQSVNILYNLMNKSKEEKATNAERIKSKINGVFASNMTKLVNYVGSERRELKEKEEEEEMKRVLFILNKFLMSFNFIKVENKNILKIYKLENKYESESYEERGKGREEEEYRKDKLMEELKRRGMDREMMVLYYLTYEYVVYNLVNDETYEFEQLGKVQDKLLNLLVETNELGEKRMKGDSEEVFVVTSSVLNVIKLSNMDFLKKTKGEFRISERIVKEVEESMAYFLTEAHRVKGLKESKEGSLKRKEKGLNIMNDGSVTISSMYLTNNNNNNNGNSNNNNNNNNNNFNNTDDYDNNNTTRNNNNSTRNNNLNMDYMAESVTYQYIKTLNQEMYNSNVSVMIIVGSCSGVERVKRSSKKFVEILHKVNQKLFNLLMLHTMFTLYEMSQRVILEEVVKVFNEFKTCDFLKVVYEIIKYIKKSQSNEKFQKYLNAIAVNNVNSKNNSNNNNNNKNANNNSNNSNNNDNSNNIHINSNYNNSTDEDPTTTNRDDCVKCEEIETLIKYIQVNNKSGTERYDVSKKMEKTLRRVEMDDEEFNRNIMMLRRTLEVKKLESYCNLVEKTMLKGNKEQRRHNEIVKLEKEREKEREKEIKKVKRIKTKDTTLVPSVQEFYNVQTTNDPNEYQSKLTTTNNNYSNDNNTSNNYSNTDNNNSNNTNNNINTNNNNDNTNINSNNTNNNDINNNNNDNYNNNTNNNSNYKGDKRNYKGNKSKGKGEVRKKRYSKEPSLKEPEERDGSENDSPKIVRRYSKRILRPTPQLKSKRKSGRGGDFGRRDEDSETLEGDNADLLELSDFEGELDLEDL